MPRALGKRREDSGVSKFLGSCFVTGTDTEIGKTLASCALLRAQVMRGVRAVGMKPVAAGAQWRDERWTNEDVERILAAGNVDVPRESICTYLLRDAVAPHLAAQAQGVRMEIATILAGYEKLRSQADVVIVEGVGGFRVPLGENFDTADLASRLALPVVLVVGMRLGCLNHAALTAEAIRARGLVFAGWIANTIEPEMEQAEGNFRSLERILDAPCIGRFPWLPGMRNAPEPSAALSELDRAARLLHLEDAKTQNLSHNPARAAS
jgi:dethiobiotin synthetase